VPDMDCFRGSFGGKAVIPLWCDARGDRPNIAEGLLERLAALYGFGVSAEDVLAYCYAVLGTRGFQARFEEVRAEYFDRETDFSPEWRRAAGIGQNVLHVTADELETLRSQLRELLLGYLRLDPADRPAGAQRVHAMFDLVPWFDPKDDH